MSVAKDPAADTRQVIADMDTHNQYKSIDLTSRFTYI